MRLIVCVKRDLHGCVFLNRLLPRLAQHRVRVLLSDKARPAELGVPELAELAYLERGLPLQRLFPLLDRLPTTATGAWASFAGLEERHGVRCELVADINTPVVLSGLLSFAPDLIVSARFSHLFGPAAIAAARFGAVNVHPGELPVHAGLFAPMRTVAEGNRQLACCLHFIDAGIDSGPIIDLQHLPYDQDLGLLSQITALYPLAIDPLLDLLDRLERAADVPTVAQDKSRRRYRTTPDAAEVRQFLVAGHRFWTPQGYDAVLARFMPSGKATASLEQPLAQPEP